MNECVCMQVYHSNGDGKVENNDANSSRRFPCEKNMPLISLNANSFIVRIFAVPLPHLLIWLYFHT